MGHERYSEWEGKSRISTVDGECFGLGETIVGKGTVRGKQGILGPEERSRLLTQPSGHRQERGSLRKREKKQGPLRLSHVRCYKGRDGERLSRKAFLGDEIASQLGRKRVRRCGSSIPSPRRGTLTTRVQIRPGSS